jgi:hypothetical protein
MADVVLVTADQLRVEESLEQDTLPAGVAVAAGQSVVRDGTTGRWVLGGADGGYGMAVKTVPAGLPVTAIRRGVIDGFDLDDLDYGDPVFAGATGATADTGTVPVGEVISVHTHRIGGVPDKLLRIDYASQEVAA